MIVNIWFNKDQYNVWLSYDNYQLNRYLLIIYQLEIKLKMNRFDKRVVI